MMHTQSLNRLQKINAVTVIGYTRRVQAEMMVNITKYIIQLILIYYCSADKWMNNSDHDEQSVTRLISGTILHLCRKRLSGSRYIRSAPVQSVTYLSNFISTGIYKWTFKIKLLHQGYNVHIGIFSTIAMQSFCYCFGSEGIAIYRMDTDLHEHDTERIYGCMCKQNDTIEMVLDTTNQSLSFVINSKKYGVAFNNIAEDSYRAGVETESQYGRETIIELVESLYIN